MCGLIGRIFEFRSNLPQKHSNKWRLILIENDWEGLLLSQSPGSPVFIEMTSQELTYAHFRFRQQ